MNTKQIMVDYLKLKVEQEDWHGVRDAAAELETLEKLTALKTKRDVNASKESA